MTHNLSGRTPPAKAAPTAEETRALLTELAALGPVEYGQRRREAARILGLSCAILDKAVRVRRQVPTTVNGAAVELILADNGAAQPIFANAATLLRHHADQWPLRYDEFSRRPYLGPRALLDSDLQAIADWVQHQGVLAGRKIIDDAAFYVAAQKPFHEIKEWLSGLSWDGIARLDMMLVDHAEAVDTALTRAFISKFCIQAVARIFEPGCQADATLVLEGAQGVGKSSLLRALFGDRWHTDTLPDLSNKDAMIQLLGMWCIESAELATFGRAESAKLKQFITARVDRYRLPWDRLATDHPRQSVFAATINPGAVGWHKDETGGRRFWPAAVGAISIAAIIDKREQFWAETVARFHAGEPWWLNNDLEQAAIHAQAERYEGDPWMDAITVFVRHRDEVLLRDIFIDCLSISSKSDWSPREMTRVARCLGHLGWERKQRRSDGRREWVYVKASQKAEKQDDGQLDFELR